MSKACCSCHNRERALVLEHGKPTVVVWLSTACAGVVGTGSVIDVLSIHNKSGTTRPNNTETISVFPRRKGAAGTACNPSFLVGRPRRGRRLSSARTRYCILRNGNFGEVDGYGLLRDLQDLLLLAHQVRTAWTALEHATRDLKAAELDAVAHACAVNADRPN